MRKLTTFIDKQIGMGTLRREAFRPAITLLSDLHSAYLFAPERESRRLKGMDRYLYFSRIGNREYQCARGAFERASRVECHVIYDYYDLALVRIEFFAKENGKTPIFEICARLLRDGTFDSVRHLPQDLPEGW